MNLDAENIGVSYKRISVEADSTTTQTCSSTTIQAQQLGLMLNADTTTYKLDKACIAVIHASR